MSDVKRRYAKYVFLDVVKFSRRSAEAQSFVVDKLNFIVRHSLESSGVTDKDCILMPTGDGMCISLVSSDLPYDVHIQIALRILESLESFNREIEDTTRRFDVRIGLNQNTDILITDINGRPNIAGAGINLASRIMDQADDKQILVSQTVFDELQPSEIYMDKFRRYDAYDKHKVHFSVHQYIDTVHSCLNVEPPALLKPKNVETVKIFDKPLTPKIAYYFAQSLKHRQELLKLKSKMFGYKDDAAVVLLWFLAEDSLELSNRKEFENPYYPTAHGADKNSFEEQYTFYQGYNYAVLLLATKPIQEELQPYEDFLENRDYMTHYEFVTAEGKVKLNKEWPEIAKEFSLDQSEE